MGRAWLVPACAGLERPFGNSEGGGASLHLQSMPRALERCTGHFEHHDGLLNHILHQDISAVGREGHPLRPMTDGRFGEFGEMHLVQAVEQEFAVIRVKRGLLGLIAAIHDGDSAQHPMAVLPSGLRAT